MLKFGITKEASLYGTQRAVGLFLAEEVWVTFTVVTAGILKDNRGVGRDLL
jgi:hypothetical protein